MNLRHAKSLRTNQTDAEWRLWYHLRGRRFLGLKFKRQKSIGPYIVDFVNMQHRLILEIDGGQHAEPDCGDRERDMWLRAHGYCVLRFWNNDVLAKTESVLTAIYLELERLGALSPDPSPASGRGEPVPLPHAGEGGAKRRERASSAGERAE